MSNQKNKVDEHEPVRKKLWMILHKLRLGVPLNIDRLEVYRGCLPRETASLFGSRQSAVTDEQTNMLSMLTVSAEPLFRFMTAGDIFCMNLHQGNMILPQQRPGSWFSIPHHNPQLSKIRSWISEATEVESKISQAKTTLRSYMNEASTEQVVRATWPSLLSFASWPEQRSVQETSFSVNHAKHLITRLGDQVENVNTLLAAGSLLEVKALTAWLGLDLPAY